MASDPTVAVVGGKPMTKVPTSLFIPPDALRVFLETFEGPLDLLLYLIRKQNLDILDIPVAQVTEQYLAYLEMMREMKMELAAEYLLMASMLAEIKSRMLLPQQPIEDEEEDDPRAELVRRLLEYERFRSVAEQLDELPRVERDFEIAHAWSARAAPALLEPCAIELLAEALTEVIARAELRSEHTLERAQVSVSDKMSVVLDALETSPKLHFRALLRKEEGLPGIVATFLAILELVRAALIEVSQSEPLGELQLEAT